MTNTILQRKNILKEGWILCEKTGRFKKNQYHERYVQLVQIRGSTQLKIFAAESRVSKNKPEKNIDLKNISGMGYFTQQGKCFFVVVFDKKINFKSAIDKVDLEQWAVTIARCLPKIKRGGIKCEDEQNTNQTTTKTKSILKPQLSNEYRNNNNTQNQNSINNLSTNTNVLNQERGQIDGLLSRLQTVSMDNLKLHNNKNQTNTSYSTNTLNSNNNNTYNNLPNQNHYLNRNIQQQQNTNYPLESINSNNQSYTSFTTNQNNTQNNVNLGNYSTTQIKTSENNFDQTRNMGKLSPLQNLRKRRVLGSQTNNNFQNQQQSKVQSQQQNPQNYQQQNYQPQNYQQQQQNYQQQEQQQQNYQQQNYQQQQQQQNYHQGGNQTIL